MDNQNRYDEVPQKENVFFYFPKKFGMWIAVIKSVWNFKRYGMDIYEDSIKRG